MNDEVIFCIDMQRIYAGVRDFPRGYDSACRAVERFSDAAAECGIPTWNILTNLPPDDQSWYENKILSAETSPDFRQYFAKKFTDIFDEKEIQRTMPIVFKKAPNAFTNESLYGELHRNGVRKIYVLGYHARICVTETLIGAVKNGFEVGVIGDLAFSHYSLIGVEVGVEKLRQFYESKLALTPFHSQEIDLLTSHDFLDRQSKRPDLRQALRVSSSPKAA